MTISIRLPRGRQSLGSLMVLDGAAISYQCPCLGLADTVGAAQAGNPARDRLKRNGDTPTGIYDAIATARPLQPMRSYGPHPPIRLVPVGGEALAAAQAGRDGLLIHGGELNPGLRQWHGLRPTHGCIRVADADALAIGELLRGGGRVRTEVVDGE